MGREESDGRVVPKGRRKAVPTGDAAQGGKATTASEQAGQLELFRETADNPKGIATEQTPGQPGSATPAKPKSRPKASDALPAMTIEEVASEDNLKRAFEQVAANHGAPGPDRQTIEMVARHFDRILPLLHEEVLKGTFSLERSDASGSPSPVEESEALEYRTWSTGSYSRRCIRS